jgi:hypothetical protein
MIPAACAALPLLSSIDGPVSRSTPHQQKPPIFRALLIPGSRDMIPQFKTSANFPDRH